MTSNIPKDLEGIGATDDSLADELYREHILEHYKHPHNHGRLEHFDVDHKEFNPLCGDEVEIFLQFNKDKKVEKVSFVGKGCAISQSSASMLTNVVKGKSLEELKQLPKEKVFELLQIPINPVRVKCALLSWVALNRGVLLYWGGYDFHKMRNAE